MSEENKELTVEEYVAQRKKELDSFVKHWNQKLEAKTPHYPKQMGEGEWFEQELAFGDPEYIG